MARLTTKQSDNLRPEYNLRELLRGGVHGSYAQAYRAGTHLVALSPGVQKVFPEATAVNDALRLVIQLRKVGTGRIRKVGTKAIRPATLDAERS